MSVYDKHGRLLIHSGAADRLIITNGNDGLSRAHTDTGRTVAAWSTHAPKPLDVCQSFAALRPPKRQLAWENGFWTGLLVGMAFAAACYGLFRLIASL